MSRDVTGIPVTKGVLQRSKHNCIILNKNEFSKCCSRKKKSLKVALFYRLIPNKTLASAPQSGLKIDKKRMTVVI